MSGTTAGYPERWCGSAHPGEVQITVPTVIGLRYRLVLLLAGKAQIKLPVIPFRDLQSLEVVVARTMSRSTMS